MSMGFDEISILHQLFKRGAGHFIPKEVVEALPLTTNRTFVFKRTVAFLEDAIGEDERTFELFENLQKGDLTGKVGESDAAIAPGLGSDEAPVRQLCHDALEQGGRNQHFTPDLGSTGARALRLL